MYCNYINCMFFELVKFKICTLLISERLLTHLPQAGGNLLLRRSRTDAPSHSVTLRGQGNLRDTLRFII
jgi:hypothetical protein